MLVLTFDKMGQSKKNASWTTAETFLERLG
jgi:hypothetical protein